MSQDAHADINTPAVSLSKNIHGMSVAFLMRLFDVGGTCFWDSVCVRGGQERDRNNDIAFGGWCCVLSCGVMSGWVSSSAVHGFEWLSSWPRLDPSRIVYIGLRDVDLAEKHFIKDLGIKAFSMQQVDAYGIGKVRQTN